MTIFAVEVAVFPRASSASSEPPLAPQNLLA